MKRLFSTSGARLSNIGSAPILLPQGVKFSLRDREIDQVTKLRMETDSKRQGKPRVYITKYMDIEGPKGSLSVELADFVQIQQEGDAKLNVSIADQQKKHQKSMWGTTRSLIFNGITGVTEGHLCIIKFVGTGFRAILEPAASPEYAGQQQLSLRLGYCVPQIVTIPKEITVQVPVPHRIILEGCDKAQVKLLAANIRKYRKPEPYKGKGVFIDDEKISLKAKKIK